MYHYDTCSMIIDVDLYVGIRWRVKIGPKVIGLASATSGSDLTADKHNGHGNSLHSLLLRCR